MKKEETLTPEKKKDKRTLTLFLALFPSLLIAGNYGGFFTNIGIKLALVFYQFVIIKAVLDDYYQYQ